MTRSDLDPLAREAFALAAGHEYISHELERLAQAGGPESLDLWALVDVVVRMGQRELELGRALLGRASDFAAA